MGVPHLVVVSGPVLVFVKNGSRAFRGGMKSWGWTGEGEFILFNSRTGTSIAGRVEKAAVGHWVPGLVIAGIDSKMWMLLI